jgi:hypothetical protein
MGAIGSTATLGAIDETKPIIKSVKPKNHLKSKSRLQDMMDNAPQDGPHVGSGGYDEEDFDSGDGMNLPSGKMKSLKNQRKRKVGQNPNSDLEATGDQSHIMRIAS